MTTTVKIEDAKLRELIAKLVKDKMELQIGFLTGSQYPDSKLNTVEVAILNEYGHITKSGSQVPPRPFMKKTFDKNAKKWQKIFSDEIVKSNYNIGVVFDKIGLIGINDIQQTILTDKFAPLSQATIDLKGHDKTLIDTTHMLNSVEFEIIKKG